MVKHIELKDGIVEKNWNSAEAYMKREREKETQQIKGSLLKWAGFQAAPNCSDGCQMLSPEGAVIGTARAIRIASQKLLDTENTW